MARRRRFPGRHARRSGADLTDPNKHRSLPDVRTEPALTDWHTLAEIRAALHAGQITGGMTLELSLAHPELQHAGALDKFTSYVSAYGVRIERNRPQAPTAVYLRRPS